ncbi:MAG: TonB-dependent receptor [Acidobacteria bacterium]|nr:TonB-dependent receptor [Acidobacteriota bacterium]
MGISFGLLCQSPGASYGQSVSGTVRGRVQDESGGVIAGAQVSAHSIDKGIDYPTQTDSLGLYQLTLPVGGYEVSIIASGFTPAKRRGLAVSVGETIPLDFTLQVGGLEQSLEVRAPLPLVETTSGTISGLVDRALLAQLPLNGRDYGQLALLEPGVVPNQDGALNAPFGGSWAGFLVNGQIDQATLFLMDGADINDQFSGRTPSGASGLLLGLDAVQEFQVLLNNFKAEFGRNSGAVIQVVTRSGSNQLHGSLFEYLRNSVLDAKNFFDLPDPVPIPNFQRNQFGAVLGGPIQKDRTFFFLNYEGLRERKGITSVATVPAASVRASAVPSVAPFLRLYPLPNRPLAAPTDRTGTLVSSAIRPTREDYGLARVDHRLTSANNLFGRVSVQDSSATIPYHGTPVPGFPDDVPHRILYSQLALASTLGSNSVNQFHLAFNRTREDILLPPPQGGLTITPIPGRSFGVIIVSGLSNLGNQVFAPFGVAQNVFEVVENFSHRSGRHSQKYGGSIQRYQQNEYRGTFFNGQYRFDNGLTALLAGTPNSWVGVLGGTAATGIASPGGWRWVSYNGFAQDDFQWTSNLTLNFGIRYELNTSPTEVNGMTINLRSPSDTQPTPGPLFNTIARSWAPRFGFAWSPFANTQSVLRGGYGIFYNSLVANMFGNSRLVPPYVETKLVVLPSFPNPIATGRPQTLSTTGQAIDYNLSQPYVQHWNMQWEQQVSSNWAAKIAYVGEHGLHMIRSLEWNPANPVILADGRKCYNYPVSTNPLTSGPNPSCPNGPIVRRNTRFGQIRGRVSDGMSWYNALQLRLAKRLRSGWSFQGSYTWSKALSTNNSSFTDFPSQPPNTQDPEDVFLDKALSPYDTRHRAVFNFMYQLPALAGIGRGHWLFGGWIVAGIASFSSGYPFSVVDGFNRSQNQQTDPISDRPNWRSGFTSSPSTGATAGCPGVAAGRELGGTDLYFDSCAFELQPAGFYGNVPRNALIGPGFANFDLSFQKNILVREPYAVEFRADFFNILNHPNFATPSSPTGAQVSGGVIVFPDATGVRAPNAGQIFRTVTDSRQIQFSLRYRF